MDMLKIKKLVGVMAAIAVISILFIMLASLGSKHEQKTRQTEFNNLMSETADCKKILSKIKDLKVSDPKNNARILETKYNCASNLGQYEVALNYLTDLDKYYKDHPEVDKFIDIQDAKTDIKLLKDAEKSKVAPKEESSVQGGP